MRGGAGQGQGGVQRPGWSSLTGRCSIFAWGAQPLRRWTCRAMGMAQAIASAHVARCTSRSPCALACLAMLAAKSRALMLRHCPLLCSFLPHIGRVTIIMNDYPWFKYALIAALGVVVLTSKEG